MPIRTDRMEHIYFFIGVHTWPNEAAAIGSSDKKENASDTRHPNSSSIIATASSLGNGGKRSWSSESTYTTRGVHCVSINESDRPVNKSERTHRYLRVKYSNFLWLLSIHCTVNTPCEIKLKQNSLRRSPNIKLLLRFLSQSSQASQRATAQLHPSTNHDVRA